MPFRTPSFLLAGVVAAASLSLALPAVAQDEGREGFVHELRIGLLEHDVGLWGAGSVEDGAAINGELAFRSLTQFWTGSLRPVIGGSVSTEGRTSYGYADLRWEALWDKVFFGVGIGAAVHDSDLERDKNQKDLGSRVLFHIPAELGYQFTPRNRLSLYFEHVSNAWLADPNPGMDNIGLRFSHRF
jgi:lipid A 3-O-deacylase